MNPTSGSFTNSSNESNDKNMTFADNAKVQPPLNLNIIIAIMPLIGLIVLIYGLQIRKIKNKIRRGNL